MDIRNSSRYIGILTKRFSIDSTSTIKSYKPYDFERKVNKKKSTNNISRLDYGDDDALIESGLWSDIKVMFWDFIPDYTPLNFVLIQLFSFMVFLSFRAITFPKYIPPPTVDKDIEIPYQYNSYIKDYFNSDEKQFDLIVNTIKLLFILLTINIVVLFIVLFTRFLFMKFLFELFSRLSRSAVLIAYSVDPGVFYLICSLINYTIFLRCLIESGITTEYRTYKLHLFGRLFPRDFWIDSKCYSYCKTLYHLHILFAVRKLILSTLIFLFELQFLANYSSDLTTYLNELSCLRKFTLKWLNYVYYKKSQKIKELDTLMDTFLDIDTSVVKKSYNSIWVQHRKDDFKIFKPILCKWQYHDIKNDLDLHDYNGTDFLKDLWIGSMSVKPSVNWIVLNYVIHNPPEILLMHHSIQLICKETVDYYSMFLFDQIYYSLSMLRRMRHKRLTTIHFSDNKEESKEKIYDKPGEFVEDEKLEFYQHVEKDADDKPIPKYDQSVSGMYDPETVMGVDYRVNTLSILKTAKEVDDMVITRDFEPARARNYNQRVSTSMPEFMKYRNTIIDPDIPTKSCLYALINNREAVEKDNDEEEDDRYITKEMCSDLDQDVVEDFFLSYDISNCSAISCDNFVMAVINMCSIRKKLITTLKNQRSILELVGNLISIILWFMSFVAMLLSFRINKNIVLPSTIGLFSATIVALSYMYTSFITAIMFVVISNPYNVGDRVRIDGQVMYVRRITTYNTEFKSSHGKHIIIQNILLSKMLIINESRAKHATLELNLKMSTTTTPASLKMLRDNVKTFVNGKPRDFVHNSIYFHCDKIQVSHYINLVIWATCVESWSNTRAVFGLRTELMNFVSNQCKLLGIGYESAISPVYFKNALNVGGLEPIISSSIHPDYNHHDSAHKKPVSHPQPPIPKNEKGSSGDKRSRFKKWDNLMGNYDLLTKKRESKLDKLVNNLYNKEGEPNRKSLTVLNKPEDAEDSSDDKLPDKEDTTQKTSFDMISSLDPDQHSPELANFLWGDPPKPSEVPRVTGTLNPQQSIGPLTIEPTFPGLLKSFNASEDHKVPKAPPLQTLQNVHKNPIGHTHFPHPRKNSDVASYQNVWLNTWSPENKPNRIKTMSFESTYEMKMRKTIEQVELEHRGEMLLSEMAQKEQSESKEASDQPNADETEHSNRDVTIAPDIFGTAVKPADPPAPDPNPEKHHHKKPKSKEPGSESKPKYPKGPLEPKHMRIHKRRNTQGPTPPPCP